MLSLTENAGEFLNDGFWDTLQHAKIVIVIITVFDMTVPWIFLGLAFLPRLSSMYGGIHWTEYTWGLFLFDLEVPWFFLGGPPEDCMLSLTEYTWEYQIDVLWDTL